MKFPKVSNIFEHPVRSDTEEFNTLLSTKSFNLEKIVSYGQSTPVGQWYDQEQIEWVMLVKGKAVLRFDPDGLIVLKDGDFLTIPAHLKHRVEECSDDAIWLALHTRQAVE